MFPSVMQRVGAVWRGDSSPAHRLRLSAIALLSITHVACGPEIGDDCVTSTDCSQEGLRICDTTQPGGYCTIFNCDADSCPGESVCISYGAVRSTVGVCDDSLGASPYARSFCMRKCSGSDECRSGYECTLLDGENPWGAQVIEHNTESARVCMQPASGAPPDPMGNDAVCRGTSSTSGSGGGGGEGGQAP